MRCALVHEAWRVEMVAPLSPDARRFGHYHSTVLDCYPCDSTDPDIVRSYEAGISLERLIEIAVGVAQDYWAANARAR